MATLTKKYLTGLFFILSGIFMQSVNAQNFTISQDGVSCLEDYGRLIIQVTSGTGPYSYYLYNGDPFAGGTLLQSIVGTMVDTAAFTDVHKSPPTYWIRFVSNEGTLIKTATLTSFQTSSLTAQIVVTKALSCPTSTDAILTAIPSGGNPPYTYLWGPGGETTTSITVGQGIYSVSVNDSYNCQNAQSEPTYFFLEGDDSIPTALTPGIIASNQNICINTSPAAFTNTQSASGGWGHTYQWQDSISGGSWQNIVGATSATYDDPNNLVQTRYYRRAAISTSGCSTVYSNTLTVTVHPTPIVDAGSDITTCTGTSAIAMTGATAGGSYSAATWSGGAGLGTWTQNANPSLATFTPSVGSGSFTATLTLTGSNGCGDVSDTRVITWGTAPVADAGSDIASCTGMAAITMTGATASGTYSAVTWSGGAGLGTWTQNVNPALAIFTPTVGSGSFTATLTLTGTNGCSNATDTRTISWGTAPVADAGSDIATCTGMAAITMTGATASGTYSAVTWSGGAGLGTWTQNANPALATFTPTVGSGSFTATLTLTGSNGCGNTSDTRLISWGTAPTVDAGLDITTCTGTANITMTGATTSGSYSAATWSGGAGLGTWTQNANPALATFTPTVGSGSFTATITLTGSNGCGNTSDTRVITWGTAPVADAGSNIATCTGMAAITMTGATASGTYSAVTWSGGAGLGTWTQNANPALATFTPTVSSGSFTATLTLTGTNGCSNATDTRTVSWGTAPAADAGLDITTCTGTAAIAMTGATASGTYSAATWSGGAGLGTWTQNANPALATFTPTVGSGSFTATLTLTGSNGCGNTSDTRLISWGTAPTADAGSDITTCTGTTAITMTGATAGGTYSAATWSGGAGLGTWTQNANPALAIFTPTVGSGSFTATLTLTGANGCGNVSDTRTISWGTAPVADAGSDIATCTGMAAIAMTGASASGTYSAATWSGGAGLGTWTQNANPALATFTPTVSSASFTATLTLTGSNGCSNATDTRLITWGTAPTVDAGSNISSCSALAAIPMTGATANGTYSSATWSGGAGLGAWAQNADPSLATFTPSVPSGSFTATLTLTGTNGCGNVSDTRLVSWDSPPVIDAGPRDSVCYISTSYLANNASASNYSTLQWSIVSGSGTFQGGITNVINPTYNFGVADYHNGDGSLIQLQLLVNGNGACASSSVKDTLEILLAPEIKVSIGSPAPFYIGSNTEIQVCFSTSGHQRNLDMGYYLVAPDGVTTMTLKRGPQEYNFFTPCSPASGGIPGDVTNLCFTTEKPITDTLNICTQPRPMTGTFAATGDWSSLYGLNPAEGGWAVMVKDTANNRPTINDGNIIHASLSFIDTAIATGNLKTINYESGVISKPIIEVANTSYLIPRGLQVSCAGECDAIGLVNTIGGIPPYINYTWNPAPFGGNGTDSVVFCAGTYNLTVTDAMGCTGTTSVIVTSPPAIVIDAFASTDTIACFGDSTGVISAHATGGTGSLTYTLLPGNIPSELPGTGSFTNLSAGTYTVHIEDINGCYTDTTVTIRQHAQLILESAAVTDSVFCSGDTDGRIEATASGGTLPYTFILEPVSISNSTGIFTNLGPGSYVVRLTDANNCDTINSDTLILGVPIPLIIDTVTVTPIACNGDEGTIAVVVIGGRAPYNIYVNSGLEATGVQDTAYLFFGPGSYDISVEDALGCTADWPVTINLTDPPALVIDSIITTPITTCYTDPVGEIEVYASGGTGILEYSLDGINYQAGNLFTGLTGGLHTVFVRDANLCSVTRDTIIASPPLLLGHPTVTHVQGVNLGSIELNPTGGTPYTVGEGYRYSIDGGSLGTNRLFDNLTAGTYQVHVEDSLGCPWDSTITIIVLDLDITVIAIDADCYGQPTGSIRVYMNDGTAPYTIYLDGAIVYSNVMDNFRIIGSVNPGTYVVGVEDATGRYNDSTVTVRSPEPLGLQKDYAHVSCHEYNLNGSTPSDGSISYHAEGGVGNYTYTWQDIDSQDSVRQNLPKGLYIVTVSDGNGCMWTDTTMLVGLDTLDALVEIYPQDPNGDYSAQELLAYPSSANDSLCYLSVWHLLASHNYQPVEYDWSPDTLLDDPANYISGDVTFTMRHNSRFVLHINNTRCMDVDSIRLIMHDTIGMQITTNATRIGDEIFTLAGDPLSLFSTSGYLAYEWFAEVDDFDDNTLQNPVLTPYDSSQLVIVIGTTPAYCYETDSVYVVIQQPLEQVFDVFTPNADGENDYWIIPYALQYLDLEVFIFNRWGQQIFYSKPYGTDTQHTWDGTSQKNGKDLPIGTYYYIIKPNDGKQQPLTGTVTIVR
jgi:gliding motility-associated-like protein